MTDAPAKLAEATVHDTVYRAGETVGVDGAPGEFKIRHFSYEGETLVVEVFGGAAGRGLIRTFRAERLQPPEGSTAHAERRADELAPDAIREAIVSKGYVEVPLQDPTDKAEKKRVSTLVFNRAYSLGLKGNFTVRVVDGKVVGQRKDLE